MRLKHWQPLAVAVLGACVLSGCFGDTSDLVAPSDTSGDPTTQAPSSRDADPAPTSADPSASPTAAPEESPVDAQLDAPEEWSEDEQLAEPGGARAWVSADTGAEITLTTMSRDGRTPQEIFEEEFGSINDANATVEQDSGTTQDGLEVLYVDVVPAGGLGGASEAYLYVFGEETVAVGVMSYDGVPGDDAWQQFRDAGASVVIAR